MATDIKNTSGREIFAHYNYNNTELIVIISKNENPTIKVLSHYINGSRQNIENDTIEFESFNRVWIIQ